MRPAWGRSETLPQNKSQGNSTEQSWFVSLSQEFQRHHSEGKEWSLSVSCVLTEASKDLRLLMSLCYKPSYHWQFPGFLGRL